MKKQSGESIHQTQKFAQFWKKIANPPIRPSRDEVLIYEKRLNKLTKNKKLKTLVFGATPELRDLALKCNQDVTSVDISWEMLNAMNLLMKEDWKKEIILKCDWLKMPLKYDYYDIAMGDNYLNMLRWFQFKPMIRETCRLLKPGGYLLTATLVYAEISDSFEELIGQYEEGQLSIGDLLHFALLTTYDSETKATSVLKIFREFNKLFKLGKVSKKTMKNLEPYGGPLIVTKPTEKEFEKLIKPYFKIVSKEYGADYKCCRYRPIYVLKAK